MALLTWSAHGHSQGADRELLHKLTPAQQRQWERLLHVRPGGSSSEVLSPDFFLSPTDLFSPSRELHATVEAMRQTFGPSPDLHPICKFPARAVWLSHNGLLTLNQKPHQVCPRLSQWAQMDQLQSTSVLLVSGYLGNPASTFGHALIRFNSRKSMPMGGLLDNSINFGAAVPEGEPIATYIAKGLLGGYEAGFSDGPYFSHDFTYSHRESRDMWEYELALSQVQQELLAYHLWEIVGKKFKYYFLKSNCASRMAELLALVMEEDALIDRASVWFAPVEMFHRLERQYGDRWFTAMHHIPSGERLLQHEFQSLPPALRQISNEIIRLASNMNALLAPLSQADQVKVLDFLLSHFNYRVTAEDTKVEESTLLARNQVLKARLALPVGLPSEVPIKVPTKISPASVTAPMRFSLGMVHDDALNKPFTQLQWAPFSYDLTGHNALEGSELVVADMRWNLLTQSKGQMVLERLDLIRVKKHHITSARIEGESRMSWQMRMGWQRLYTVGKEGRLQAVAQWGAGWAQNLGANMYAYGLVDGVLADRSAFSGLEPNAGVVYSKGNHKAHIRLAKLYARESTEGQTRVESEFTQRLSQHQALKWTWREAGKGQRQAGLAFVQHW
jgi:Domain of unknown function (DUF4105)